MHELKIDKCINVFAKAFEYCGASIMVEIVAVVVMIILIKMM